MSLISLLEIINIVLPHANIFGWIVASVAYAAVVNPKGFKTFSASSVTTYFNKGKPVFSNGPKSLPEILLIVLFYAIEFLTILCWLMNITDCFKLIHKYWVFPNGKVLRSLET